MTRQQKEEKDRQCHDWTWFLWEVGSNMAELESGELERRLAEAADRIWQADDEE